MLPLELIRKEPDRVKRAAELKGEEAPIDAILAPDTDWRHLLTEAESTKAEQNALSKQFGQTKDQSLVPRMRELADQAKAKMAETEERKRKLDELLRQVPNLFHESVPIGKSEADNVVVREWGDKRAFGFSPASHQQIGEKVG